MRYDFDNFSEVVSKRLDELGQKVGTVERSAGLKTDTIRNILRSSSATGPHFSTAREICNALGLEFYIGPPREIEPPPETEVDGDRFAAVARHDAQAAAGGGFINFDGPPIDHLAFSKTWLQQNGIQAGSCSLINALGESMEPNIYDGDLIMIDHRRKQIRNRKVYVYNDPEQGTRIKRLEIVPNLGVVVHSDNEDENRFPTEYHVGSKANVILQNIVGEVVWSGHKWV